MDVGGFSGRQPDAQSVFFLPLPPLFFLFFIVFHVLGTTRRIEGRKEENAAVPSLLPPRNPLFLPFFFPSGLCVPGFLADELIHGDMRNYLFPPPPFSSSFLLLPCRSTQINEIGARTSCSSPPTLPLFSSRDLLLFVLPWIDTPGAPLLLFLFPLVGSTIKMGEGEKKRKEDFFYCFSSPFPLSLHSG